MATLNAYAQHTLAELANRTNNGNVMTIAEILSATNLIFDDIPFFEANSDLGEVVNRRLSLPSGTWRRINQGVSKEASQTVKLVEGVGSLQARSEIDKDLVNLSGNPAAYRQREDLAFVEGLGQTAGAALIYGNVATDPERFNGLATRLPALASGSVYGASGTGNDVTSVYVVKWSPNMVYGIYPKGSQVGLSMTDLGEIDAYDANNAPYRAYATIFDWKMGIAVKDTRAIKRIANIETTGSSNIFDEDLLIRALNDLPGGPGNIAIYCNKTIKTQMDILAKDKSNVAYTSAEVFGRPVTAFQGVPVRLVDAILNTESAIS